MKLNYVKELAPGNTPGKQRDRHWAVRNARQHAGKKSFCHSVHLAVPLVTGLSNHISNSLRSASQCLPGSGKTAAQARQRNHLEDVQSIKPLLKGHKRTASPHFFL